MLTDTHYIIKRHMVM